VTVAFFVAATVVTILQYLRVREKRLLPLMAAFALTAAGHCAEGGWSRLLHMAGGASGLALVVMLAPRHVHPSEKPPR
jgi:hypothetical protein